MLNPLRLRPGDDLLLALEAVLHDMRLEAAFVVSGIGSLDRAALRHAGEHDVTVTEARYEILSLQGTLSVDGAHLHMAVADRAGQVRGGHVKPGCRIATTAEILLAVLPAARFVRTPDAATGYAELAIEARGN